MISELQGAAFPFLVHATGVLAVILIAERALARWTPPASRHHLVTIGLLKFFLPSSVLASLFMTPALRDVAEQASYRLAAVTPAAVLTPTTGADLARAAAVLWLGGALVALLRWRAFRVPGAIAPRAALQRAFASAIERWPVQQQPRLSESAGGQICTSGILRPHIHVPQETLATASEDEVVAMLVHELAHIRRRDNLTGAVLDLLTIVLWWHPLVWYAKARAMRLREHACDQIAVARTDREAYERAIARACLGSLQSAMVSTFATRHIRSRLAELAPKRYALPGVVAPLLGIVLLLAASTAVGLPRLLPAHAGGTPGIVAALYGTPVGAQLLLRVHLGPDVTNALKVYSEPSHTLLLLAADPRFVAGDPAYVAGAGAALHLVHLPASFTVTTRRQPRGDMAIAVIVNRGQGDELVAEAQAAETFGFNIR